MWNLPTDYDYQTDLEKSRFTGTWKKKPYKCQFCEYSSSWKDHLKAHICSVHEKRSLLNVIFVILLVHTSVIWNYMFLLFMREKSLSNLNCVTLKVLQKMTWVTMLPLFMKEKAFTCEICEKSLLLNLTWGNMKLLFIKIKCLSNVNLDVLKNMIWIFISHLLMKKEALNFSVVLLSKRVIWNYMYLPRP